MHRIIGGILSLRKGWSKGVYSKNLSNYLQKYDANSRIDIGFCLESGSFIVEYNPTLKLSVLILILHWYTFLFI